MLSDRGMYGDIMDTEKGYQMPPGDCSIIISWAVTVYLGTRDTKMNETWLLDIRILQSDGGDRKKKNPNQSNTMW